MAGDILQINWRYLKSDLGEGEVKSCSRPTRAASARKVGSIKKTKSTAEAFGRDEKFPRRSQRVGPRLSKYRRRTANARERQRMGEINAAFEVLKERIPPLNNAGGGSSSRCEKLTKINVLHIAINYIRAMEAMLEAGGSEEVVSLDLEQLMRNPFGGSEVPVSASDCPMEGLASKSRVKEEATASFYGQDQPAGASTSAGNSSPADSGIQEEEEEEDDIGCPDWTELCSSLESLQPPVMQPRPQLSLPPVPPSSSSFSYFSNTSCSFLSNSSFSSYSSSSSSSFSSSYNNFPMSSFVSSLPTPSSFYSPTSWPVTLTSRPEVDYPGYK